MKLAKFSAAIIVAGAMSVGLVYADTIPVPSTVTATPTSPPQGGNTSSSGQGSATQPDSNQVGSVTPAPQGPTEVDANNGADVPLDQGTPLDAGTKTPPTQQNTAPSQSVNVTPAPVQSQPATLPKTGNDPYTSNSLFLGISLVGIAALCYLLLRSKKARHSGA